MVWCPGGCAKRRKALKRFVKTAFKGNKPVSVPENNAITKKYVDKMNVKFGKKRS